MLVFLLKILLAHFVGDFLLQPKHWVDDKMENKHKSKYLYFHVAIHAVLLLLVLQFDFTYVLAFVFIPVLHFIIDALKLNFSNEKNHRKLFFIDQLLHFLVLFIVAVAYFPQAELLENLASSQSILFLVCLLFATFVSNIMMTVVLSRWDLSTENNAESSLEQAGKYIGFLERIFIFIMIIAGYPLGVGFLITAKSVFRYNDLTRAKDRRLTEYVLIGSLMSFGLAIIAGLAFNYLKDFL